MSKYKIQITKLAIKDINTLTPKLKKKLKEIFTELLINNPYIGKRLLGDLDGNYSYRLNLKDRIIYSIDENKKIIYIKRARTHYGE